MHDRRRRLPLSLLTLTLGALAACSSDPTPPDLGAQLEKDTGVRWTVYIDARDHEVRFLAPERPVHLGSGTPEEMARAFLEHYKGALHASGRADEIVVEGSTTDPRGNVHVRFAHQLPGTKLPVFGAASTAHFTADGSLYWLITGFRDGVATTDATPVVTEGEAMDKALAHVRTRCGRASGKEAAQRPTLGVRSLPDEPVALVYQVVVEGAGGECELPEVTVDATTGAVTALREMSAEIDTLVPGSRFFKAHDATDTKVISVTPVTGKSGVFQMVTADSAGPVVTQSETTGVTIESRDLTQWDPGSTADGAAADASFNVRNAYAYFRGIGPRTGPDPLKLEVRAIVHARFGTGALIGCSAGTRFVRDPVFDRIRFGDGGCPALPTSLPFSGPYDVAAHEVGHVVILHTSNLERSGLSEALNESFADVMGASAEHATSPDDTANFLMGEGLFLKGDPKGTARRDLRNPRSKGHPDHVDLLPTCAPGQRDGVCNAHSLGGVPSRAFSLIVEGGAVSANGTRPRTVGVPSGIGWEAATDITYWATTSLLPTANFELAALAQAAEATRYDVQAVRTVVCAWRAVGVAPVFNAWTNIDTVLDCVPPPPSQPPAPTPPTTSFCAGRPDGLVCDSALPYNAIACRAGIEDPGASQECANHDSRCKRISADNPYAVIGADGIVVCE
ncbi:MAG: Zinc metalloproteinase precursor [Labilithrix sp.]|nr:Zinc metalloproteinase precursor [Labilithrix sp.]